MRRRPSTHGPGQGGELSILADNVLLSGSDIADPKIITGIISEATGGSGEAGDIEITARQTELRQRAVISALAAESSTGPAGNIEITFDDMQVIGTGLPGKNNTHTGILSRSSNRHRAGDIAVNARESLRMTNGGQINVDTVQADAGNINLKVGRLLYLTDASAVTTSAAVINGKGTGDGGNININPLGTNTSFVVLDNSNIIAQAIEGRGGKIAIKTDILLRSPCAEHTAEKSSRFIINHGQRMAIDPDGLLPSVSPSAPSPPFMTVPWAP